MKDMNIAICVTSINEPKPKFLRYTSLYDGPIYWIGDRKTPPIAADRVKSISLLEQLRIKGLTLPKLLPVDHYARKNVGYLAALMYGADWVLDTDDDNFPKSPYHRFPTDTYDGYLLCGASGRVNIYKYYTQENVWPRGLGYQFDAICPQIVKSTSQSVAVWQGLADGDPDVDAVYRLANLGAVSFDSYRVIVLDRGLYCPFNSQNTIWKASFLPYAYLPSTVTFRFTDILRGYIAQRAFWAHQFHLGFVGPNVVQERNEHDLIKDLESELIMYKSIDRLLSLLEGVSLTVSASNNLLSIYESLVTAGIVKAEELRLLNAWLDDIAYITKARG